MKHYVQVEKRLVKTSSFWDIGKGAKINLDYITQPMAEFLKSEFVKDTTCLSGSIFRLFEMQVSDFEANNKREP